MLSTQSDDPNSAPKPNSEGLVKETAREIGKGLVGEIKNILMWGLGGAILGALVLGGFGFAKFGQTGLGIGAVAGGVIGAVLGAGVYIKGSSLLG